MNISYKIFYLVELCNFDIKSYFHLISFEKIVNSFVGIVGFHCRVVNRSRSKSPPITSSNNHYAQLLTKPLVNQSLSDLVEPMVMACLQQLFL